jgi:TatD DNase family protein
LDALFFINTAMIAAKSSGQLLRILARDRVLTETDGPFVKTGSVPSTPIQAIAVTKELAALWQMTEACNTLLANFASLTKQS